MPKVTPFLMFKRGGKEAVEFYAKIFKDCRVHSLNSDPTTGQLYQASFSVGDQDFNAMDGGDHFSFSEGVSLFVSCKDQAEIDYYWKGFIDAGGEESQCGWLKDKWGLSWQIIPENMGELISTPSGIQAMMKMHKIIIRDLEEANNQGHSNQ